MKRTISHKVGEVQWDAGVCQSPLQCRSRSVTGFLFGELSKAPSRGVFQGAAWCLATKLAVPLVHSALSKVLAASSSVYAKAALTPGALNGKSI